MSLKDHNQKVLLSRELSEKEAELERLASSMKKLRAEVDGWLAEDQEKTAQCDNAEGMVKYGS